jgi:carbon monoxide dehydrogenase subunit G
VDRVIDPLIDGDGRLRGFSFETVVAGMTYLGKATPKDREEFRLMAWNIENSEVRGVTAVHLSDDGDGTRVEVILEVESVGMFSSMFFPVIAKTLGSGLPRTVDSFAAGFD